MSENKVEEALMMIHYRMLMKFGKEIKKTAADKRLIRWFDFQKLQVSMFEKSDFCQGTTGKDPEVERKTDSLAVLKDGSDSEWETVSEDDSDFGNPLKLFQSGTKTRNMLEEMSDESDEDSEEDSDEDSEIDSFEDSEEDMFDSDSEDDDDEGDNYPTSEDSDEEVKLSGENSHEEAHYGRLPLSPLLQLFGPQKLFSGNPLKWTKFWMAFERYRYVYWVFKQPLTKEKCLVALKSFLVGEACAAVDNFIGDQYDEAIALLKERYGKPELIEEACLKYVSELPELKSENLDGPLHLYYNIFNKLQYFVLPGNRLQVYSEQVVNGLLSKLPPVFRSNVLEKCKSSPLTLDEFLCEFKKQLQTKALRMGLAFR